MKLRVLTFRDFNIVLIYLYVLFTFLFPVLFVNKAIFVILIFNTVLIFPLYKKKYRNVIINPFIIQILFLYGYGISLFSDCNMDASLQFAMAPLNLFIIYLILYYEIDFSKIIRRVSIILAISVLVVYSIFLYDPNVYTAIGLFLQYSSGSAAGVSQRDFLSSNSGGGYLLFFALAGSYHLFLSYLIYFKSYLNNYRKKSLFCSFLILAVVLMAGARAQLIIALISAYFLYFFSTTLTKRVLSIIILMIPCFFVSYYLINSTIFFSMNEYSNSAKIGEVIAFFENMSFVQFLMGSGLASYYFVDILGKYLYHTELSLLDLIRYIGFFQVLVYVYVLICPVYLNGMIRLNLKMSPLIVIFALLLYSFTNPVLFNSLGHIVILWCWSKQLSIQ